MIRLVIPFLLVAIVAWVMSYALTKSTRKKTWLHARHAMVAITISIVTLVVVFLIFSIIGAIHG